MLFSHSLPSTWFLWRCILKAESSRRKLWGEPPWLLACRRVTFSCCFSFPFFPESDRKAPITAIFVVFYPLLFLSAASIFFISRFSTFQTMNKWLQLLFPLELQFAASVGDGFFYSLKWQPELFSRLTVVCIIGNIRIWKSDLGGQEETKG